MMVVLVSLARTMQMRVAYHHGLASEWPAVAPTSSQSSQFFTIQMTAQFRTGVVCSELISRKGPASARRPCPSSFPDSSASSVFFELSLGRSSLDSHYADVPILLLERL